MAKSWQQGQDSVVCTPLPLFLTPTETHRGSILFHNTHQSTLNNYLFTLKKNSPNSTHYWYRSICFSLLLTVYALLYHANSGDSLTCCERVNHRGSAATLSCCRSRKSSRHCEGRWEETERESLVGSRHLYKVEPAGWEQEGELFISAFSCLSVLCESFTPHLPSGW